jgi:hypothetical protein
MEQKGANCLKIRELGDFCGCFLGVFWRVAAPRFCREKITHRRLDRKPQNFVTSVKLKSRIFIAGTTISNDSSPLARTGALMASTLESI